MVYQGKVLLVGQLLNSEFFVCVKQIVMGVEGIIEVYNEICQGQFIGLGIVFNDIWIIMKVCLQLLISDQVKLLNVKVIIENGEVFLLGLVIECEGKVVVDIVSWVSGVKCVIIVFMYIK